MFNEMFSGLRGVPRQLGSFMQDVFRSDDIVSPVPDDELANQEQQSFIRRLQGLIPTGSGDIVSPVPSEFEETEPGRFIRRDKLSPTPAQGKTTQDLFGELTKGSGQGQTKGASTSQGQGQGQKSKVTIKQQQPDGSTVTITQDQPQPTPTPTLAPNADQFEQTALPLFNQAGIPPEVGFGIAQAEGGRIGTNNPFNIQAYDSNPNLARNFQTPEEGIQAFIDLLAQDPRYQDAWQLRDDPSGMLEAIMQAGFAGDPNTWQQRSAQTGGAGQNFDSWDEFVRATQGWSRYMQ